MNEPTNDIAAGAAGPIAPAGAPRAPGAREVTDSLQRLSSGGQVLRMIEESHADFLGQRFVGRPVGRDEQDRGPESVARFPNATQTGGYGYAIDANGIVVVSIKGAITPESWAWYDDFETISDWIVRDLDAMAEDPNVKGALFDISSPGGYVAGSFEMADAIARFAAKKPTATFASGYCCSAAFLQAVGTDHITAYRTTLVGSIGTRSAVIDAREYFAKFGVKVIPLDSGGMKSAGLIGTEVTPEQIAYLRGTVIKLQELFTQAVADGRGASLDQAKQWADGRVHVAGDGKSLGLIDAVGTKQDAYAALAKVAATGKKQSSKRGAKAGDTSSFSSLACEAPSADSAGQSQNDSTAEASAGRSAGGLRCRFNGGRDAPGKGLT
jgi:signal peptide peptidase SppA